jgi:hypothetical protein
LSSQLDHQHLARNGKNGFVGKLVSVFMDCDKMVGPQFEQGFGELSKVVNKI